MVGSIDSLDFSPELTICEERISISLNCWQDVCLSDIWIPSHLLPSRKQPSNTRITKGIFHTLEKRDARKCIESFRVYSAEELFFSDSDEDCKDTGKWEKKLPEDILAASGFNDINTEILNIDNNKNDKSNQHESKIYEYLEKRSSGMKTMPSLGNLCNIDAETNIGVNCHKTVNIKPEQYKESTITKQERQDDSLISLHDILENTPLFNINDFKTKDFDFLGNQEIKLETNQKKNKNKNKASRYIALDEFRKDYKEADYQSACCNDYFQKILYEKNKSDALQILNTEEFPGLAPKDIKFIHPENVEPKSTDNFKMLEVLNPSIEVTEHFNTDHDEKVVTSILEDEKMYGKLVVENIPEVPEYDIHSFFSEYGEIKSFSLQSTGKFFTAYVELELVYDIDWIIECLNGTEAFGASTRTLKCYQQD